MADGISLLHVDDDPAFTELTAAMFDRLAPGLTVRSVESVAAALTVLETETPDAVVSDYDMPGSDGLDLLAAVRERCGDLPFVLFTGKGSEEVASQAISAGVTDYLQKGGGRDQFVVLANRVRNAVERHRSLAELAESEKRLSLFIEQSSLGVIEYDDRMRIVAVNPAAEAITGYTEAELLGGSWDPIVPEEMKHLVGQVTRELLENRGGFHSVNENVRKDGTRIVCEWHNRVVTDDDGEVVSVFSQFQEVTDQARYEEKLEQLRQRTHELMDTRTRAETARVANDIVDDIIGAPLSGIHVPNATGDELVPVVLGDEVAERFAELPVYPRDAAAGSRAALVWDVYEGGVPLEIDDTATDDRLSESSPARSVLIHPLGDHGVFIVSTPVPSAFDETDASLVELLATTVTAALDRVAREVRLREREAALAALHGATRSLLAAETPETIAQEVCTAAEEVLGFSIVTVRLYDPEREVLVPVAASHAVDERLPERVPFDAEGGSLNWAAFAAGQAAYHPDISERQDAHDIDTSLRTLMLIPLGEYGTLAIGETMPDAFDETDIYLAGLLATAAETALATEAHNTELRDHRNRLQRQNERLAAFASVVSHDLRNPLAIIDASLSLAAETGDDADLARARTATDRMGALIDDLLALARAGEARGPLAMVPLAALVTGCWDTVPTDDASLAVETGRTVEANRSQLKQLLENLLRNAVTHGGPGVRVAVRDIEGGFAVDDDGPGIPPDERPRVVEQGYSTAGSHGFGLAIVREVADAHGWTMRIEESPEGGARFAFTGVRVLD